MRMKKLSTHHIHSYQLALLLLASATILLISPNHAIAGKPDTPPGHSKKEDTSPEETTPDETTTTYDKVIGTSPNTEYYHLSGITGEGSILVDGDVVMVVDGDIKFSGQDSLTISQTGSLKIYFAGDFQVTGKSYINNLGTPSKLIVVGTHPEEDPESFDIETYDEAPGTVKKFHMGGNGEFCGVLYAPNAFIHVGGGGNDEVDVSGAMIGLAIKYNGKMNFHGDEDLDSSSLSVSSYGLDSYALLQAGADTASSEAATIFGSSDYNSLFQSLFEND